MTATTQPRLSADEVAVLKLLAGSERIIRPRCAAALTAMQRLWDLNFLTICPPGERYKLSLYGYATAPLYGAKREANHVHRAV